MEELHNLPQSDEVLTAIKNSRKEMEKALRKEELIYSKGVM